MSSDHAAVSPSFKDTRRASTVIICRPSQDGERFDILLQKRPQSMRFMAGMSVFPGGCVEVIDFPEGDIAAGLRRAACREVSEEAGIFFKPSELSAWERWITPESESRRYDTMFYLAWVSPDVTIRPNATETKGSWWFGAEQALRAAALGSIRLSPPTAFSLTQLSRYTTPKSLLRASHERTPRCILPSVGMSAASKMTEEGLEILLPWDPDYTSSSLEHGYARYDSEPSRIMVQNGKSYVLQK